MEHYQHYPIIDNIQSTPSMFTQSLSSWRWDSRPGILNWRSSAPGEHLVTELDAVKHPHRAQGTPGVTWKRLGAHPPHPLALILSPNTATRRVGTVYLKWV